MPGNNLLRQYAENILQTIWEVYSTSSPLMAAEQRQAAKTIRQSALNLIAALDALSDASEVDALEQLSRHIIDPLTLIVSYTEFLMQNAPKKLHPTQRALLDDLQTQVQSFCTALDNIYVQPYYLLLDKQTMIW